MHEDLVGKTALVTGGARGLGLSMARALAGMGVRIGLVDILEEVHGAATKLSADASVKVVGHVANLTDPDEVESSFVAIESQLGNPIDILINSAGIGVLADAIDVTSESWHRVMSVNLDSTLFCCQALARRCVENKRPGTIINISSMSGFVVNVPQQQTAYNVSKAAVAMLTQSLAVEWMPLGIRVNAIAPGYFASDMTKQFAVANPPMAEEWLRRIPIGRMGEPDELAGLVVYLASDVSRYMYGQNIIIDGGYTLV